MQVYVVTFENEFEGVYTDDGLISFANYRIDVDNEENNTSKSHVKDIQLAEQVLSHEGYDIVKTNVQNKYGV